MMIDRIQGLSEMENDPTAERTREPSDPTPDNNMNIDEDEDNNDDAELAEGENETFDDDEFDDEEFGPQEFSALNNQLDQLQSALDSLESRNDDIQSKLKELLQSSREIRQVMKEENNHSNSNHPMEVVEGADANPNPGQSTGENSTHFNSAMPQKSDMLATTSDSTSKTNSGDV